MKNRMVKDITNIMQQLPTASRTQRGRTWEPSLILETLCWVAELNIALCFATRPQKDIKVLNILFPLVRIKLVPMQRD